MLYLITRGFSFCFADRWQFLFHVNAKPRMYIRGSAPPTGHYEYELKLEVALDRLITELGRERRP